MKVKIDNIWYDSRQIPIVVEVEAEDRALICKFAGIGHKHAFVPNNGKWTKENIEELIKD